MDFTALDPDEFRAYAQTSPYKSFYQTPEIAALREANYNYGVYVELSRESPQAGKRGWANLSTPEEKAAFEDEARALAQSAQALKLK